MTDPQLDGPNAVMAAAGLGEITTDTTPLPSPTDLLGQVARDRGCSLADALDIVTRYAPMAKQAGLPVEVLLSYLAQMGHRPGDSLEGIRVTAGHPE